MRPELGKIITSRRTFSQDDFNQFAILSGDDNPIHVDPAFAATTKFGSTVAHGMLLYGVICGTLYQYLPGSIQIDQRMMFVAPTFTGEEVTTRGEVVEIDDQNQQFRVSILMTSTNGKIVCDGECLMQWSES